MSRQLNLRVSDEFVEKLERVARELGRPMAAVLEEIGTSGLDAVEADLQFEADALAAWEAHQLNGDHVTAESLDSLFTDALARAEATTDRREK
jgi:predicted transcriptional regulator